MDNLGITTSEDLVSFLQAKQDQQNNLSDLSKLRYAIYLRKSTDDPEKQVRSIEDQESECIKFAETHGIVVLKEDILREHESAKVAGVRPLFRKLMDRLTSGELDGVIAWHPNRLARNMLEAGEIIDLLDRHIIKDLKFASHTFVNDPSGKMLLGIVFVMAKQYSDQLSTDVMRGNRKSIESGAYINKAKHGYYKDINQHLRPDGMNYAIMKEAFQMRIQGKPLEEIAAYLNNTPYTRKNAEKSKPIKTKFLKQTLSTIFSDPVYAGVLRYGSTIVELEKLYDFMPMITIDEFIQINNFDPFRQTIRPKKVPRSKELRKADLLNGKVSCNYCKELMYGGISKNRHGVRYYYFRCDTSTCERYKKSTRAKVIFDFAINYFLKQPFSSEKAYSSYKNEILRLQKTETGKISNQINSAKRNFAALSEDIQAIELNMAKETDIDIRAIQKEERSKLQQKEKHLRKVITELEAKRTNVSKAPLDFEEFIKTIDEIPEKLQKVQSTTQLDSILSKVFLNLFVTKNSVEEYTLKAPFGALECLNDDDVINGGRCRT